MRPIHTSVLASAFFALAPSFADVAAAGEYANPHVLMSVEDLRPLTDTADGTGAMMLDHSKLVLVDVRSLEHYDKGHIPGARPLDPNAVVAPDAPVEGALRPMPDLASIFSDMGLSASTRIVFYDDKAGFHAARMFWLAEYMGHQNVAILNGGLDAWTSAGYALSDVMPDWQAQPFTPSRADRRQADADYILSHASDRETKVIDVRGRKDFAAGHIPWATNVPWKGNLTQSGLYLPAEDLAARFADHGITNLSNVVIHCQVGLASSHSYVALRLLGHPRVRVYHRSWAEWGTAGDLPIAMGTSG